MIYILFMNILCFVQPVSHPDHLGKSSPLKLKRGKKTLKFKTCFRMYSR